jgi:hypothetical protein
MAKKKLTYPCNGIRTNSNGHAQNVHEHLDGRGTVRWIEAERAHEQRQDGAQDDRQKDDANWRWSSRKGIRAKKANEDIYGKSVRFVILTSHFMCLHVPKLTVMANVSSRGTANNAARTAPATPNRIDKANPMTISCIMVLRTLPSWMLPVAKPRMTLTLADGKHKHRHERRLVAC